jgi:hypothetical protein
VGKNIAREWHHNRKRRYSNYIIIYTTWISPRPPPKWPPFVQPPFVMAIYKENPN